MKPEGCTWVDCHNPGTNQQKAQDGEVWAHLCDDHHKELDDAIASGNIPKLVSSWAKAHGNEKNFAKRMMP